ncbi:MAG: hypothetical protein NTY19_04085 [Planctomycetota bacterium]|nr:hypothetical protein [Planctomycetota bacterium]
MALQKISKIVKLKPEPQTTPALSKYIQREMATECVSQYYLTPSLRAHFKRIFECVVHRQGQGFWVQAEYGAGKTHFLATIVVLLMWLGEKVWDYLLDDQLKQEYADALAKTRMFPVAFSLRGMGQSEGQDSLMRIFEEQIRESLELHDPALAAQVKLTSAEIADAWYANEASTALKAAVAVFFQEEHHCTPADFRAQHGPKKFGQELARSTLAEGRLKGKFKERFAYIYDQITKLGNYDGILFVVDEFRSWQDRHLPGTAAYAEDEEVLETLAFVLPTQHLNIITIIASQGDMPQKLSGGGQGDRFIPLYLLADKNKGDFGEIVTFRCRELVPGAATDIKDYYDLCRKTYKFIKQGNVSLDYFTAIFPFQPRTFDVMRRITQSADKHNLPTARSAIRMAWQTLSDDDLLKGKRLITLSDIIRSDELRKGLNHEQYRDDFQGLQGALEQLPELDVAPEEREQARRVLETLFLWVLSLPDNLRDGLTAQEVAEAAWLMDEAVDPATQASHILNKLTQSGFPLRAEKKTRDGKELDVYSYETSVTQINPLRHFSPLKKKAKEDLKSQDAKWVESLFWQLADLTAEAQEELGVNGGILADFQPPDQRSAHDRQTGKPAQYQFSHTAATSTKRVHKVQYGGEVIVSDRWRAEFGEEIKNPDQHFRLPHVPARYGRRDNRSGFTGLADRRLSARSPVRGHAGGPGGPDRGRSDEAQRLRAQPSRPARLCGDQAAGSPQRYPQGSAGRVPSRQGSDAERLRHSPHRDFQGLEGSRSGSGRPVTRKGLRHAAVQPQGFQEGVHGQRRQEGLRGPVPQGSRKGRKGRGHELRRRPGTVRQVAPRRIPAGCLPGVDSRPRSHQRANGRSARGSQVGLLQNAVRVDRFDGGPLRLCAGQDGRS